MNIKTFTDEISRELCRKGKAYFDEGRIRKLIYNTKGNVRAIVHGTSNHDVEMHIDNKTGMISDVFCDCNTFSRSLCQHCIAVMFACREKYEQRNAPGISSRSVTDLINRGPVVVPPSAEGTVDIIPHISFRPSPAYELTMGITRMYKIRNIRTTYSDFLHGNHIRYGKDLSIDANMSRLTERGRRLLDITMMNFYNHNTSYFDPPSPKLFPFTGQTAEDILNLFAGDTVLIDEQPNRVIKGDPKIEMEIESSGEDFVITNARSFSLVRGGSCDLIHIPDELTVYIASPGFHATMYPILRAAASEDMIVSRKDMPAFYSAVIRQAHKYADFINEEMIASLIPPEMTPQMYIDADKNGNIVGLPVFVYGDRMINYSPADKPDPFRDLISERHIIDVIKDVMHESSDPAHPFICDNDEMIYLFLTEGSKMLMTEMEVYVSERFRSMTVRPPIKPVVGIRPDGDLLSLDISDSNYSHAELLEVLQAYRKGAKFHRLKDGTFAIIGEEIAGFEELANNLNITDRQFLKENIRIPKYRMMYLDNLKNMDSIRLKSSSDFKNMVSDYRKQLDGSDLTEVPAQLRGTMRDYQQYGFHWLKTIASYGFGGILADDMGLGKTIQALALMLDAKKNGKTPFLVVCPSSLTLNWLSEAEKFAPTLRTAVIAGTAPVRADLIAHIGEYDLAVTSYAALTRDIDKYEGIRFAMEFIDEAQYIKNHVTQAAKAVKGINAPIRFALTGTPVENSLAELWSIFDFIMPDYLFGYTRFKKTYETPIVTKNDEHAAAALQRTVSPFILRRLKKDVLTELPEKTEIVLVSVMEEQQRKLYTAQVMQTKKMLGSMNEQDDRIRILAQLMRLRQICCDPSLIYEDYASGSAKLEQCMELIENCINAGHKLLLFSQFTSMLDIIDRRLDTAGISRYKLTGSTKPSDRLKMVNRFNADDTKVFLISLKAGGTGLNLTGADIVIHYDPWWNLSAEEQASDRVYRIGQKNNVTVYKLIADKSIEQNILKLQEKKAALSEIAVGGDGDIMHMSVDEIISMIE